MIARLITRVIAIARSTPVRIAVALCGAAAVALILRGLGWSEVYDKISHAAGYLPIVLALDGTVLACSMLALRSLYGAAGPDVPVSQLVRAGLVGFAVNGLLPAGRAVAEVTRASLLSRWVGSGTAAAAAARMQAVVLVAHGTMSVAATIAAVLAVGWTWLPLAIGLQAILTLAIGVFLLAMATRVHIGAWLGRRVSRARVFGSELDAALARAPAIPTGAIAWELAGRCVEVVQKAVLIACIGGVVGVSPALCVEGLHLVGAAIGDLVPAQLGVQEGNFTLASAALGLPAGGAVVIALLAHVSQLAWVLVGTIVPLVWRAEPPAPATP
jgi:hypothetical protein